MVWNMYLQLQILHQCGYLYEKIRRIVNAAKRIARPFCCRGGVGKKTSLTYHIGMKIYFAGIEEG